MQLQNTFDLDEFIAYLFPGALFVAILALGERADVLAFYNVAVINSSAVVAAALGFIVFLTTSMVCGHLFSVISRFLWRPLLNWLGGGNPDYAIFNWTPSSLRPRWTQVLRWFLAPIDGFFTDSLK